MHCRHAVGTSWLLLFSDLRNPNVRTWNHLLSITQKQEWIHNAVLVCFEEHQHFMQTKPYLRLKWLLDIFNTYIVSATCWQIKSNASLYNESTKTQPNESRDRVASSLELLLITGNALKSDATTTCMYTHWMSYDCQSSFVLWWYWNVNFGIVLVITCLLYTSPSPRD